MAVIIGETRVARLTFDNRNNANPELKASDTYECDKNTEKSSIKWIIKLGAAWIILGSVARRSAPTALTNFKCLTNFSIDSAWMLDRIYLYIYIYI